MVSEWRRRRTTLSKMVRRDNKRGRYARGKERVTNKLAGLKSGAGKRSRDIDKAELARLECGAESG